MHLFSVLLPIRIRSISDRYQDHRFPILGEIKRFFAKRRIEIADPTSPQALFSGCQTQMFHRNGNICIAMILIVEILPTPGKRMVDTGQNHARRRANPIAIVTGVDFLQFVFLRNDMKTPRLVIHGRRCHSDTFHHIIQLRFFKLPGRLVFPHGKTSLCQCQKIHNHYF